MSDFGIYRGLDGGQEKEKKPGRLILEIGASGYTAFGQYGIPINPGDHIIFSEIGLKSLGEDVISLNIDFATEQKATSEYRELDARHLDLPDESIDLIVASNVLNAPTLREYEETHEAPEVMRQQRIINPHFQERFKVDAYNDRRTMIFELVRVLKSGGKIRFYDAQGKYLAHPEIYEEIIEQLRNNPSVILQEMPDLVEQLRHTSRFIQKDFKIFEITKKPSQE